MIGYYRDGVAVKVGRCGTTVCPRDSLIDDVTLSSNPPLSGTSIALGADPLPVVSHHDAGRGDLKVVKCSNQSCD